MRRTVHVWMPGAYTRDDAITPWLKTVLRTHPDGRLVGNNVLVGGRVVATWRGTPESSTSDSMNRGELEQIARKMVDRGMTREQAMKEASNGWALEGEDLLYLMRIFDSLARRR